MNLDKKLELAHEFAMEALKDTRYKEQTPTDVLVEGSWQYADAMEAEAEKRIKAKAEKDAEDAKVFFEHLKDSLRKRPK